MSRVAELKVAEGVHQFKVPMRFNPLGYTFVYYLQDSGTLIDAGVGGSEALQALKDQLSEAGAKTSDVKRIIPTHLHGDHVTMIPQLLPLCGAPVLGHREAVVKQDEEHANWSRMAELTVEELNVMGGGDLSQMLSRWSQSLRAPPERLVIDQILEDGEVLRLGDRSLRVYWTPGHAREHICLYDADSRILFSGDHVLPKITSHVALHTWADRDPLSDYLTSLRKVKDLPVEIVLPGHERSFTDLAGRVEQLNAHHKARCGEVTDALKGGEKTIYQVSSRIHWDSRPWPFMDFWTKRMAATETYAHLVYLRNRGEVTEEKRNNVLYYRKI